MSDQKHVGLRGLFLQVFVIILMTFSAACAEKLLRPLPPPQGGLKGRICDKSTGNWVEGAMVTLSDRQVESDEDGFFAFEGLQGGEYEVVVESTDYASERVVVVPNDGMLDISQETCLQDLGSIEGRICDEDAEAWVASAQVEVSAGDAVYTTISDELGHFALADIPVGQRDIVVGSGDFSETYSIEVQADTTVWAGDIGCGPSGHLAGRVCGGEGY
ncbi:MAG: carboxypeptidase regulatory-like domain-containing protein, partial [Myxococcota bacterium]|nr:carboxypeptidase regulatory-like domain-containing protein [Myxococcota bacterium]